MTQGSRTVRSASVSPDGQWIVFDTSLPQEDLFIVRPDGSGLRQLTNDVARDRVPHWMPDSSRVLFYSNRGGTYGAWTIRADGSGLQPVDHGIQEPLYNPMAEPGGERLVATIGSRGAALIDLAQPPGRRVRWLPRPASGREAFSPTSWSADGQRLAGTLEADGSSIPGVVVYTVASGAYERLTAKGIIPVWLPDSRTLLYLDEGKIFIRSLDMGEPRLLLEPPLSSLFTAVAVAPDGRTLYAVRESDEGDIWMMTLGAEER